MRVRDMTDATRAALSALGFLPDGLKGAIRYIDEVPPGQRKRDGRWRRGKIKGALDPLDRVLVDIIRDDPYMPAKDVLGKLHDRAKAGDPVVRAVRREAIALAPPALRRRNASSTRVGSVVTWRHTKTGKQRRTAARTIRNRLARLRALALKA